MVSLELVIQNVRILRSKFFISGIDPRLEYQHSMMPKVDSTMAINPSKENFTKWEKTNPMTKIKMFKDQNPKDKTRVVMMTRKFQRRSKSLITQTTGRNNQVLHNDLYRNQLVQLEEEIKEWSPQNKSWWRLLWVSVRTKDQAQRKEVWPR